MKLFCLSLIAIMILPAPLWSSEPVTVIAKQVDGAPGAIVCGDLTAVSAMLDSFRENRDAATQPAPQGQTTLTNGDALEQPSLDKKGCEVAKAGTRMTLNGVKNGAASVTFKMADGKSFSGVTQPNMYSTQNASKADPGR